MTTDDPLTRLAVYGSLAPGESNHHQLAGCAGSWTEGWVAGVLHDQGWGAGMGFPGIELRDDGEPVRVQVLESDQLREHWQRLDAFEGPQYERRTVRVRFDGGLERLAQIYALRGHAATKAAP